MATAKDRQFDFAGVHNHTGKGLLRSKPARTLQ
jgi:hypothetical protein